jgi:TPP-dependent pyruvate/acetoin dehydrogenase alpha subunit
VQVETAALRALAHIRADRGPFLLECRTYRFRAHSMFDAQAYRQREEVDAWRTRDPIARLGGWMRANHQLDADEDRTIAAAVDAEIAAAVAFAEAGTLEPEDELERFVLMDAVVQDAEVQDAPARNQAPAPGSTPAGGPA